MNHEDLLRLVTSILNLVASLNSLASVLIQKKKKPTKKSRSGHKKKKTTKRLRR